MNPSISLLSGSPEPERLQPALAPFEARIAFLMALARHLHQYGTSASRLELVITTAGQRLGLEAEVWSSPTAIITSFTEASAGGEAMAQTQVIRLIPGDVDLRRLCEADRIADQVVAGRMALREGMRQLQLLAEPDAWPARLAIIGSYGLAASSVAALLMRSGWADLITAGLVGLMIGTITVLAGSRPRLFAASEAVCALLASLVATLVSAWVAPLSLRSVVLAGLIILMPGMALTTAVREISSQHLVAGVARFGGAVASLLKLTFGTVAGFQLCAMLGIQPQEHAVVPLPSWTSLPALLLGSFSFAISFRTARRDWAVVMGAVMLGYFAARWGGELTVGDASAPLGLFLAGILLGALANVFTKYADRPGILIREPGIILLVPGSAGYRSVSHLLTPSSELGVASGVVLLGMMVSLVAGLMFGDLLVTPRQNRNL
ncbi:threonine/serine exporter family protein [Frateuria aurantia]